MPAARPIICTRSGHQAAIRQKTDTGICRIRSGKPGCNATYPGLDPTRPITAQGFDKDLSGNELPNAPPFTVSAGAQYTMPLTPDWAGTLRGDYYWQDYSWARVFNDNPYDRLRGYTNVNLTLILTSQAGWQVMLYDKNVFNTTAITGDFLNSDDSGLDDQRVPDRSEVDRHPRHEELVGGNQ